MKYREPAINSDLHKQMNKTGNITIGLFNGALPFDIHEYLCCFGPKLCLAFSLGRWSLARDGHETSVAKTEMFAGLEM